MMGDAKGTFIEARHGASKFLFREELEAYRALRREGKALALLKAVGRGKISIDLEVVHRCSPPSPSSSI